MSSTQRILRTALALLGALWLVNCSSGSSSDTATTTTYYWSNGLCYQSGTNTVVSSASCASGAYSLTNGYCYNSSGVMVASTSCSATATGTSGYYMANGYCYMQGSNQIVSSNYCTSTVNSGIGSCVGVDYFFNGYGYQSVYCSGYNCSGNVLYNNYGQQVRCQ